MSDFLQKMAEQSYERVAQARQRVPERELRQRIRDLAPVRVLQLHGSGFDLIAEVKRRSPSAGARTAETKDPELAIRQARCYADAGAAAISVLTEPQAFQGSLHDLRQVAAAVEVPVMRKDFLVDPYQVLEARDAGAAGVLLILRMLTDRKLEEMLDLSADQGMFVLLEAFDTRDLERTGDAVAVANQRGSRLLVGLNSRDLTTLQVRPGCFEELCDRFPPHAMRVAESGLSDANAVREVARLGYRLALVGGSLMASDDPRELAANMLHAGRREAMPSCG